MWREHLRPANEDTSLGWTAASPSTTLATMDQTLITDAIVLWLGYGRRAWPYRNDQAVLDAYGADRGERVLQVLHELADDFFASNASVTAPDLVSMGDQAASEFRLRHPDIGEQAVKALAWDYTYTYK